MSVNYKPLNLERYKFSFNLPKYAIAPKLRYFDLSSLNTMSNLIKRDEFVSAIPLIREPQKGLWQRLIDWLTK